MEQMIEHVARTLNKDPLVVKSLNFYKQGQVSRDIATPTQTHVDTAMLRSVCASAQGMLVSRLVFVGCTLVHVFYVLAHLNICLNLA